MRKILSLLMMLLFLGVTQMWGENLTKTEGFETKEPGTNYQGTVTVSEDESDCEIGWSIYYGTVSTNDKISGSKSVQMRYYNNKDDRGYVQSTTAVEGLSNVAFKARVSNLNMKLTVSYSANGTAWTALAENVAFTEANKGIAFNYDIPSGGKYIKFEVGEGSTKPTSGNIKLIIDDVVFTYASSDPEPETQTVYLNGGGSSLWNQAGAEFFAHTWGGAEAVAVKMTLVEGDVYSAAIPADNNNVVFVRMAPESSAIDWDNCWNKTEDLTIEGENNLYTITAWGEGDGNIVCAGAWSVYGEGGGDTPEPPVAEKDSIFFVNVSDWATVRVHLWGGSAAGTEWPGVEMTKEAEQINGHDVYKFVADEGAYASCIFNNNDNGAQTADLTWNSGKYFYDGTWYAKENIPADEPAQPVDPEQMYVWNGVGVTSAEDAIELGGAAEAIQTTGTNIAVGVSQKGNWCLKANKGFSSGAYYLGIALDNAVNAGDTIKVAYFRTTENNSYVLGMDFSADKASVATTYQILSQGDPQVLASDGTPVDSMFIVPEGVANAKYIRLYRNSGGTGLWVAKFEIVAKKSGETPDPEPETQTVYLNGGGSSLWNQAGAEFFAHTWGGAEAVAVKMTLIEGDVYSAAIPADNNNVVFVRMAPESSAIDWDNCWNKTEDLTIEGENNLYTITAWGEGDGNIVCAGAWSVYGEGGGDTPEPPVAEKDSIFFVNASDWIALRVHLWGGSAAGTEWPGVEMTPVAEKINSYEVFKLIVDKGAYASCIFNNNDHSVQTTDLDWNSGKYFYKDAWYAKEAIPAETPVTTFVGFDVQDGTLGTQLAAGLAKNRANVTFVEGEGDNQNKYSVNLVEGGVEGSFTLGGVVFAYKNSTAGTTAWKTYLTYIQPNGKDREVRIPLEAGKQAKVVLYEACDGVLVNGESTNLEAGENILTATADGIILKSASTKPKIQAILPVDAPDQPEELPVVKIAGSWDEGWDQHVMEVAEDSLTASFTMNLEADNYDFKIVKDGKWLSKYGTSGPNGDQYGINRIWNHADHVNIDAEGAPNFYLEADVTGEYTFTWTFADDSLYVAFPEAPAAPKFYVTGGEDIVGEGKATWGKTDALESYKDTLVLNLSEGAHKFKLITPAEQWLGLEALTDTAYGLYTDDDTNICFNLAEPGAVTVIFNATEFKVEGNFYVAPVEKDSIFFVNVADWAAVRVHLWGGSAAGTEWPGVEMTKEAEQINGHDVYKLIADKGAYANCIFNNNDNGAQTGDLDWNSGKYYYVDAWYAKEDIPTVQPEEVVFTVNVPEGTDSVFIAGNFNGWTFEKMDAVEGQENKYTITKNIAKEGAEYKYTAGPDWAYVELPEEAPNRTWAALDEVIAWKAVPQPVVPVDMKDLEIVAEGEWAAEGEKLGVWAWNAIEDEGHWFATAIENEKLMAHIPVAYDKVIVARFAADAELDWNNKLAQTSDLDFNECAKLYLATAGANWCAPVPAFEPHDFFITGNAALVGEELAWNPNAIPVDGSSKVLKLGAGNYEMKIVLDNCGASHCQQWLGCDRLSEDQAEGVECSKVGNIEFALAGEEDITITLTLTETDTIIKLEGNFYHVQMVDLRLVPGAEWAQANAKFAAVTWREGQEMANDGVFTDWFVGGDTVVAQIPENAQYIAFARFAPGVEEPFMNPEDENFWNHTDMLDIDPSMIYTVLGFEVEGRNFCPGYWGEEPDFIANGYFLLGTFNDWTADEAYQFGLVDEEGQRKVTAALAVDDHLKVAKFDRGYRVQWFPAEAGDYIVDADHAGSAQDVYFREDYGGADDWHAHCIYVVENSATAIDNTAVDAKAVKMLKNGMILIIKGDKTYNIMGQIVK